MAASGKSKKKMSLNRRNTLVGLSFILPNFIGFFIFVMIPVAFSLMLSFADWDGFNPMKFAGLDNFVAIFKDRVFRGGVICPGLSTGLRALGERCAQLPQVRLSSPKAAIGVNTESCMLSGSVLGTAVLLDGITQRIEEELGRPATLVVTGGLAKYVTPLCRHPLTYDPELLMKGLALLYQLNAQQPQHHSAGGRHYGPQNQHGRARQRYPRKRTRCERADEARTG